MATAYYGHRNIVRKSTATFLSLFDKMYIEKFRTNGSPQLFRVPIQFANREKWMQQIETKVGFAGDHDGFTNNARFELDMIFPRISVNITSLNYDTTRKVGKTNQIYACEPCALNELEEKMVFAPAPWNIEYEMAVISKNMDDGLQIIEQIAPFFQPSLSVNINFVEGFKSDSVPIILDSITPTHDEDLDADVQRNFIWLLNFRMKVNFHPPKKFKGRIDEILMNIHPNRKDSGHDLFTQYQLNAMKLENINDFNGVFALVYNRDDQTINVIEWGDEEFEVFQENFRNSTYEIIIIRSEGEFDYTADEFYMTDIAGTTTYIVNADYNLITIKTTTSPAAIGAPQLIQFKEITSDQEYAMAINASGKLEVTPI